MDGILRVNGYQGFLENFDEAENSFDPDYACMVEICQAYYDREPMTVSAWAEVLIEDLLKERLTDRSGKPKSKRARSTLVGNLFTQYLGVKIEDETYTVACEEHGKGHPKTYYFKRISQ